jgi:hypothetical protein
MILRIFKKIKKPAKCLDFAGFLKEYQIINRDIAWSKTTD